MPKPNASKGKPSTQPDAVAQSTPVKNFRKPTILKSGNAQTSNASSNPPGVFGSWTGKLPMTLLSELCQRKGWNKPQIDVGKGREGFYASATLSRRNAKDASVSDSVSMRPPQDAPANVQISVESAQEARHYAAIYALFRVANNQNLRMTLPTPCRSYWSALEEYKASCPESKTWLWSSDPFDAQAKRAIQQEAHAKRRLEADSGYSSNASGRNTPSDASERWPELKISLAMRERLQKFVTGQMHLLPDSGAAFDTTQHDPEAQKQAAQSLLKLGFHSKSIDGAMQYIAALKNRSNHSSLAHKLANEGIYEAALEYLKLTIPEINLPPSMQPSKADMRVTAMHNSDQAGLALRWQAEMLSKQFGFPLSLCQDALRDHQGDRFKALSALLFRLTSQSQSLVLQNDSHFDEELDVLKAIYADTLKCHSATDLELRIPASVSVALHIYFRNRMAIFFVSGASLPAYQLVHLSSMLHRRLFETESSSFSGSISEAVEYLCEAVEQALKDPPDPVQIMQIFADTEETEQKAVAVGRRVTAARRQRQAYISRAPAGDLAFLQETLQQMMMRPTYQKLLPERQRLPAFANRAQVIQAIQETRVTLITAATGSGKTTQCPQLVLDSIIENGDRDCNIIVTQPRRLAAIGVASRIADERAEALGQGLVGYQIRGEAKKSAYCRLLFMTTGVLLRRLQSDPNLSTVTHVFVDEVHERSIDSDFLLLELKEMLGRNSHIRIILMSATPDPDIATYFHDTRLLNIAGVSYDVEDVYLENIISDTCYRAPSLKAARKYTEAESAQIRATFDTDDPELLSTLTMMAKSEQQDPGLYVATIQFLLNTQASACGILIFTTGVAEISRIIAALGSSRDIASKADLLPLHAGLSNADQSRVFRKARERFKIIVATNVAETSITIDDIEYVIDSGRVKEMQFDASNAVSKLVEVWTSRAAAKQRRGRAGRTKPGKCYKLYSRYTERQDMPESTRPEILRTPLDQLVLIVMASKPAVLARAYLGKAISPPSTTALDQALMSLQRLRAVQEHDGDQLLITPLGKHMATLPIDLRLAKMLILGVIFRCVRPLLTIAACLSSKPLYTSPPDQREEASASHAAFCEDQSDLLAQAKAFEALNALSNTRERAAFASANFLSISAYHDIQQNARDLENALQMAGYTERSSQQDETSIEHPSQLLKGLIAATCSCARVQKPDARFDEVLGGTVQREQVAREIKYFDAHERVFIHPASSLFSTNKLRSGFVSFFDKQITTKAFIRQVSEAPLAAILLFCSDFHSIAKGIAFRLPGSDRDTTVRAWSKTASLMSAIKTLFDSYLEEAYDALAESTDDDSQLRDIM